MRAPSQGNRRDRHRARVGGTRARLALWLEKIEAEGAGHREREMFSTDAAVEAVE
jgi:hypothetical protein